MVSIYYAEIVYDVFYILKNVNANRYFTIRKQGSKIDRPKSEATVSMHL